MTSILRLGSLINAKGQGDILLICTLFINLPLGFSKKLYSTYFLKNIIVFTHQAVD